MFKHRSVDRTESVIAELVEATCAMHGGVHVRHVVREALHGLVRLAKVEQLMEMKLDAERAAGGMTGSAQRRHTKALLRKIGMDVHSGRRRLTLEWRDARGKPGPQPCPDAENDCGER